MVATIASALDIPDSLLAKEATDILRDYSTELLINHSIRVYLFAAEQGRQQKLRFDAELILASTLRKSSSRRTSMALPTSRAPHTAR
jgi:hypothetical protein